MVKSNMYSISADEIRDLFADYLDGADEAVAVALSSAPLGASERNALDKSLEAFGYGAHALTYVTLKPLAATDNKEASEGPALDPQAQFLLLEGLDPICLIACDDAAIASLEATFRTTCKRDTAQRVFGRPCVLLRDLSALLASDQGKQRAWALLKTLPRIPR